MSRILLSFAAIGTAAALFAGFLGFVHPAFDTAAHFRAHLSLGLVVLAAAALFAGMQRSGLFSLLLAAMAFATCWQAFPLPQPEQQAGRMYKMLQANLRFDNAQPQLLLELIARERPDILNVQEVSELWMPHLKALEADYPHVFHCPEWSRIGGVMLLSRLPIEAGGQRCHDYASLGSAIVVFGDIKVTLGSVHLRWPWPASGPRQIEALKAPLGEIGGNALVAGDFNATVWSHSIRRFAAYGGLSVVSGIGPSWIWDELPARLAGYAGLPIDNVLAKGAVRVFSAKTLRPAGSDHLPILVEFTIDDSDCCKAK